MKSEIDKQNEVQYLVRSLEDEMEIKDMEYRNVQI